MKKYPEFENVYDAESLPIPRILASLMEYVGSTYPQKILVRRVNLLSKEERKYCDKLWNSIFKNIEKIDDIISTRAENENDPWETS